MDEEIFESNDECKNVTFCAYCAHCNNCDECVLCYMCNFCLDCDTSNYCEYSKGLQLSERMIFCLGNRKDGRRSEGYQKNYRIFNKDVSVGEYHKVLTSLLDNKICVDSETLFYEEAWNVFWNIATNEQKNAILNIPQFDKKIFESITSIKI